MSTLQQQVEIGSPLPSGEDASRDARPRTDDTRFVRLAVGSGLVVWIAALVPFVVWLV